MPKGFMKEDHGKYTELDTVESQRNDLTLEEFPEGPYGMELISETLGKSTAWRENQRSSSSFTYENRQLHEGLPRVYPADHDTHDQHNEDPLE